MRLLAWLFPPRLPHFEAHEMPVTFTLTDHIGDGILWVAYDVRRTGIERYFSALEVKSNERDSTNEKHSRLKHSRH